jgi:predicted O-methyltransferase YrrM
MKKFWRIISYLNYRRKAKTRFKIHSPFVYDLVEKVFRDRKRYKEYKELNKLRHRFLKRNDKIEVTDFGVASGRKDYVVRVKTLGKVVKQAGHTKKQLELLFRLSRYFKPGTILEFGTLTGLSASYLSKGNPEAKVITMEGSMGLATVAGESFEKRGLHIELEVGEFDAILDNIISKVDQLDMVFFDGNHRKKATLGYFNKCMTKAHENSIFLFDDIHWSRGMQKAWKKIKSDKRVSLTIDLYWLGIVFFRSGVAKQDFIIR